LGDGFSFLKAFNCESHSFWTEPISLKFNPVITTLLLGSNSQLPQNNTTSANTDVATTNANAATDNNSVILNC
jgi:hypothetical protein